MKHTEFNWKNSRQENIFAQSWEIENPKAVLAIVHGMGEHSSRYEHLAAFFNKQGFSCYTFDHIGHGKSDGKRGHTESLDELLDGIQTLIDYGKKQASNLPVYLFGHSMGGNLVLNYAMRKKHDLEGLIVSAPWIRLAFQPPSFKMKLAAVMNKIYPKFTEKSDLKGERVTRTAEIASAYDADNLIHQEITTRFFFSISEAGNWILQNSDKLKVRTLLMHGTADSLTDYSASKEFAEKAGNNLRLETFDGWFHELHNEPEHLQQFDLILNWMKE